jgi:hypothetical protein
MPYSVVKFLNSSLESFQAAAGWGGQTGQLEMTLVDDPATGDSFNPGSVGSPKYFNPGGSGFTFNGLLADWKKVRSTSGNPTYRVILVDPREILEGTQVILAGYNGAVTVPNVLNPFGYLENLDGFGGSQINESGFKWNKLRDALVDILAAPGAYGGPLSFRGSSYTVDFSQMPSAPDTYRVGGGTSMSLLDIIGQVCQDAGCDYLVTLVGLAITIKVVSRQNQPPLGTLQAYADAAYGTTLVSNRAGQELRNEDTCAVLVGGAVTDLVRASGHRQFWGYNSSGQPVFGTRDLQFWKPAGPTDKPPYPVVLATGQPADPGAGWSYTAVTGYQYERFTIDGGPVSDVLGSVDYESNDLEMRAALQGYPTWSAFVRAHKGDDLKNKVFSPLRNPFEKAGGAEIWLKKDLVNDADQAIRAALNNDKQADSIRLFEYVRSFAEEYLGKAYALPVGFVDNYVDPETNQTVWSHEVDDGGYLEEGSSPLGLDELNEDKFKTQDDRFRCFVKYQPIAGTDLSQLDPAHDAVQDPAAYVSSQAEAGFIPMGASGDYAVLVRVPRGLWDKPLDGWGNADEVMMAAFRGTPGDPRTKAVLRGEGGFSAISIHPAPRTPQALAVPFRSNVDTYGPWSASGAPGKVRVEQDASLVPWNYGGFSFLDAAATSRVTSAITNMQVGESGEVEEAGMPAKSLGETLSAGGPNITHVDVRWSPRSVTTTYGFRMYTPRFGVFTRGNAERLRRVGLGLVAERKAAHAFANEHLALADALAAAGAGQGGGAGGGFAREGPKAVKRQSPHEYLVATVQTGFLGRFTGPVTTATAEEALAMIYPDDPTGYVRSAACSLDTVFVPYSTQTFGTGVGARRDMPQYWEVSQLQNSQTTSRLSYDLWGQNPVNPGGFTRAAAYPTGDGLGWPNFATQNPRATGEIRSLALRTPLMLAGWGRTLDVGNLSNGTSDAGGMTRPTGQRAAPFDMYYDQQRGVWTSANVLVAQWVPPGTGDNPVAAKSNYEYNYAFTTITSGFRLSVYPGNNPGSLPSTLAARVNDNGMCGPLASGDPVWMQLAGNVGFWRPIRGVYPRFSNTPEQILPNTNVVGVQAVNLYPTGYWQMGAGVNTPSGTTSPFYGNLQLYGRTEIFRDPTGGQNGTLWVDNIRGKDTQRNEGVPGGPTSTAKLAMAWSEGLLTHNALATGVAIEGYFSPVANGSLLFVHSSGVWALNPPAGTGAPSLRWNPTLKLPEWA